MKKTKEPGVCIFCGARPVTAEHLWAQWIGELLPGDPTGPQHHTQVMAHMTGYSNNVVEYRPSIKQSRGQIHTRKIRKVCGKRCNGGWMSQLEGFAKRAMTAPILGQSCVLSSSDLRAIANWAVLTTIICEFTDPSTQAVSASERAGLMQRWEASNDAGHAQLPDLPPNWRVLISSRDAEDWHLSPVFNHTAVAVPRPDSSVPSSMDAQSTTFGVGRLMVHCTSFARCPPKSCGDWPGMTEIWPTLPNSVQFPSARRLIDAEFEYISRQLLRCIDF